MPCGGFSRHATHSGLACLVWTCEEPSAVLIYERASAGTESPVVINARAIAGDLDVGDCVVAECTASRVVETPDYLCHRGRTVARGGRRAGGHELALRFAAHEVARGVCITVDERPGVGGRGLADCVLRRSASPGGKR